MVKRILTNTLRVSEVHRVHHQEYINCSKQPLVHVMGRDDVYPVETSKVGSLLHYVIAYLGLLIRLLTLDVSTGYASSRPMT